MRSAIFGGRQIRLKLSGLRNSSLPAWALSAPSRAGSNSAGLRHLDNRQLAAFGLRDLYRKHAAIRIDDVSDFFLCLLS